MNILILTGKFGMGHWSASQSLRQQLLHNFPEARVEVEDFLSYAAPNLADTMYKGFNMVVTYGSQLFNIYYKLTSMGHPDARPPFEGVLLDKLAELLHQYQPDAVIATHPLCAQLVSRLKEQARNKGAYGLDLPLITCVTDVSSHPEWINQNTDCYLVASREVRQELAAKGVDPALICVTGIPVREEFRFLDRADDGTDMGKESMAYFKLGEDETLSFECYGRKDMETNYGSIEQREADSAKTKETLSFDRYEVKSGKENQSILSEEYTIVESGRSLQPGQWSATGRTIGKSTFGSRCKLEKADGTQGKFHGLSGGKDMDEKSLASFRFQMADVQGRSINRTRDRKTKRRKEVLIMGGGLGLLPKSEDFYESLNQIPDVHVTIITGHNQKLCKRLQGRWENIQVIGYTNQVWEYMWRADLIVTKPGGITLFETIFARVPILTWPPTLQQEKGNARWLTEEGIGWVAGKKNCADEIREILSHEGRLAGARYRMDRLREQMRAESINGVMEVIAKSQGVAV